MRCVSPQPFARNWGDTKHYWTMRMGKSDVHSKCFKTRSNYATKQSQPQLALVTMLG